MDLIEKAEAIAEEWKEFYEEMGEPHPSSNAYLSLMRDFWFRQGIAFAASESKKQKK